MGLASAPSEAGQATLKSWRASSDLWYFSGEPHGNPLPTEVTLEADARPQGHFLWSVTEGADKVELSLSTKYLLDSFPAPVCDNIRISRCRLARGEQFRGRSAAKRRYFYGLKVQVVTTEEGVPVEMTFLPGAANDTRGLGVLPLALPAGSELFMDSGYADYGTEDAAREADGVSFAVQRKRRSRRWDEPWRASYKQLMRKRIETAFSQITALFPRHIHATSFRGFQLKVSLFIIAFALDKAFI